MQRWVLARDNLVKWFDFAGLYIQWMHLHLPVCIVAAETCYGILD